MVRAVARIAAPAVAPQPPRAQGERGHVLVVEDQSINQTVARGILDSLGYGCDVAANGIEALERLRADERTRDVPVVAVTASVTIQDQSQITRAGFDAFVSKPISVKAFLETVNAFVGKPE